MWPSSGTQACSGTVHVLLVAVKGKVRACVRGAKCGVLRMAGQEGMRVCVCVCFSVRVSECVCVSIYISNKTIC